MKICSAILSRLMAKPDFCANLDESYTDNIVDSAFLNEVLLKLNMLIVFIHKNLINASLLSEDTCSAKELHKKFVCSRKKSKLISSNKLTNISRAALIESNLSSKDSRQLSESVKEARVKPSSLCTKDEDSPSPSKLWIPSRINLLFSLIIVSEAILTIRYMLVVYVLYGSPVDKTLLTLEKSIGIMSDRSARFEFEISLNSSQLFQREAVNTRCKSRLEAYLNENFKSYYLWNTTAGLLGGNGLVDDWLLMEQSASLQMFRQESIIVAYLVSTFLLTCGIVGCILGDLIPYDVAPMVFIYDPKFVAFSMQSRLNYYLELIRLSYLNYYTTMGAEELQVAQVRRANNWPSYAGGAMGHASEQQVAPIDFGSNSVELMCTNRSHSEAERVGGNLRQQQHVVDSISLSYEKFDQYIPTARSQNWRRWLIILSPCFHLNYILATFSLLVTSYLMTIATNDETTRLNNELKSFLLGAREPAELGRLQRECIIEGSTSFNLDHVRQVLASNFAAGLRSSHFVATSAPINQRQWDDLRLVAHSIAPIHTPNLFSWSMPILTLVPTSLVSSLYLVIYMLSLADLCFWLVELQLKLNICAALLKRDIKGNPFELDSLVVCSPQVSNVAHLEDLPGESTEKGSFQEATRSHKSGQPQRERKKWRPKHRTKRQAFAHVNMSEIFNYLLANYSTKIKICQAYANRLSRRRFATAGSPRMAMDEFLVSAYLDFRLFLDQIDECRNAMNFIITYSVMHSLNLFVGSTFMIDWRIKLGLGASGVFLLNFCLIGASFFQSQCAKLNGPIHGILAFSQRSNKTVKHLAMLWRRTLIDLSGSRSKFSLKVWSLSVSYTTALQVSIHAHPHSGETFHDTNETLSHLPQFNLTIASLYILTVDKLQ